MAQPQYTEDDYLDGEGPDLQEQANAQREQLFVQLDVLGIELAKTRSEAIAGREASGIETEWREDEEYYEGIDDANRRENPSWSSKPMGSGGTDSSDAAVQPTGSTVFPNITRPYCDAASARASDMLLPTDDVSWQIGPTPVPELVGIAEGKFPAMLERQMASKITDPQKLQAEKDRLALSAKQNLQVARESAMKAQDTIQDWHIECQYHAQVRSCIESAAKIGVGVLKGPIPKLQKHFAYIDGQLVIQEQIRPVTVNVDPWNLYPDPACGENIHNGSYIWERDDITHRVLEGLKGTPGYINAQIDKCLAEGPFAACRITERAEDGLIKRNTDNLYEIWYMHGMAKAEDLMMIERILEDQQRGSQAEQVSEEEAQAQQVRSAISDQQDYGRKVYVQITMINNRVIRFELNTLDTGEFPYDVMVWQKRKNHWAGIGVARQVRVAQNVIKAGFRSMMDNGGHAAGPQVIVNTEYIKPENGVYEFTPWKIWLLIKNLEGATEIDAVFRFAKVDMMQSELEAIIQLGLRLAEDASGLPMIMQGQTNSATPTTLGGMQLQDNNASTVLRRIARLFDDLVTEPHIRRYYAYLLQYHDDNSAKGEFVINAMGSSALVERALQGQQIAQMANIVTNPIFGVDPRKWFREYLRSNRFDVARFEYEDEEWQKVVERLSQAPQDSSLQVAQIREEGALQREQLRAELAKFLQASKEAIEERKLMVNDSQFTRSMEFEAILKQVDQDVIAYQEQVKKGISDDTLKTRMAETVLKLRPIFEGMRLNAAQLPKPPAEPAGRAAPGESYAA